MIAVDTNILIYAHRADSPFHQIASDILASLAAGQEAWAIPWPCIHEFLSVTTNRRAFKQPTPLDVALSQIETWLESPNLSVLAEAPDYWPVVKRLLTAGRVTSGQFHDAHVAALCIQHNVRELWSADRDFGRFPDLKVVNPLVR